MAVRSVHIPCLPRELMDDLVEFADGRPPPKSSGGRGSDRDAIGLAIEEAIRLEVIRRREIGPPGRRVRVTRVVSEDVLAALDRLRGPGESMSAAVIEAIRHLSEKGE